MLFNRNLIRYFLIILASLCVITMLRVFRTQFNPSLTGCFFALVVAVILLLFLLYDVYFCGDKYSKNIYKKKGYEKFIIFSLHLTMYWIFGVYGVAEYGNFVFGSKYSVPKYTYLVGDTGTKGSRCRHSMVLVDVNDPDQRERYCSFGAEYSKIKGKEPLDKYDQARVVNVVYRKSFLGSELIKLEY